MNLKDWLFGWKPEKYKWYSFYDMRKTNNDWTNSQDRFKFKDALKISTFAYIKGKKHRAKFYITKNYCEIIAGKHKIIVPIKRCSFKKRISEYYQGQSHVTYYYLTIVAHTVSKDDYERYKKFKKK